MDEVKAKKLEMERRRESKAKEEVNQKHKQNGKNNGSGYDLGGRSAKSLHRPNNDLDVEGYIVVDIWVTREGKVVRAEVAAKGTTLFDNEMCKRAVQAALHSSFTSDSKAPEEQHGTITYAFVINQ